MAKVFFPEHLRQYSQNIKELEVSAATYRELVVVLNEKFPGIEAVLLGKVAVAIDGDISHDPYLEPLTSDSEVYFLHPIEGG